MTTNVPQPTFSPVGFIMPTEEQILAGVLADFQSAFGGNMNPALTSPQGQWCTSLAASIANADEAFLFYTTQTDPAFAQGRMQDAIGRIYFIERNPAEPTTLQASCSGSPGVVIPTGALIQDNAGQTYTCTGSATIGLSGNVIASFANLVPGPIAVPNTLTIYQKISGWDSVSFVSGVVGVNTESQSAFEARRAASVAGNSIGSLPSIQGAVLSVPGVLDCYVTENTTSGTATVGGVVLVGNSLYVAVVGGSAADVAKAIWSKKAPGCAYNGNTTVVVTDNNPGYSPPFPTYNVTFQRPSGNPIFFSVVIKNSIQVPSNALAQIQAVLLSAFAGGTFGATTIPKARIGSTLYATQYVPAVTSLGAWAEQIVSLQIGSQNTSAAVFTGSAGGTSLHVTAMTSGTLGAGDWLVSGSAAGTSLLVGTQIAAQVSGTAGGVGFYTLNFAQPIAIPSQTMTAALANQNLVSNNINQVPTLDPTGINLTLQ